MDALKRSEAWIKVPDLCRELAISVALFYRWRETPCRLATSGTGSLSASRKVRTICSSLYRLFFIAPPLQGAIISNSGWSENIGASQYGLKAKFFYLILNRS